MSELEKVLIKLIKRLEKVGRQQEVGITMMHLMVLQLDGRVEVSNETMTHYLEAMAGTVKKVNAFRKHIMESYFNGT